MKREKNWCGQYLNTNQADEKKLQRENVAYDLFFEKNKRTAEVLNMKERYRNLHV